MLLGNSIVSVADLKGWIMAWVSEFWNILYRNVSFCAVKLCLLLIFLIVLIAELIVCLWNMMQIGEVELFVYIT